MLLLLLLLLVGLVWIRDFLVTGKLAFTLLVVAFRLLRVVIFTLFVSREGRGKEGSSSESRGEGSGMEV